jgi:uncharacterized protein (DUF924 family)
MANPAPAEVVDFWRAAGPEAWFRKDAAFDASFRERFLLAHEAASRGDLDGWLRSAEGCLALLILLDQFPRNAFRDSPRMYATDPKAREVARHAVAQGVVSQLEPQLRRFVALPFQHSESLADQDTSVAMARTEGDEALRWATHHREVIARFGRFPHRNAILGRPSTADELSYLQGGGFAG